MIQSIRIYFPLLGFVLPTAFIGYGFVLPRNGVCGVNELTVGFATTILGAALTYLAGVRLARQTSCSRRPWRRRLAEYINRQAAAPRGLFGRLLGFIWSLEHRRINQLTLDLLDLEPRHDVLELGCGPGVALREASRRASEGHVLALDVSEAMVAAATRRNRAAIAAGRVRIRRVDGADLEIEPESFDRIFAVHSIYFWKQPLKILAQLRDSLRAGGRLALTFRPEDPSIPLRFRDPIYRFYTPEEIASLLEQAGLVDVAVHSMLDNNAVCVVARRVS